MKLLTVMFSVALIASGCMAGPQATKNSGESEPRRLYHAYWLEEVPISGSYKYLLVTRGPIEDAPLLPGPHTHPLDAEAMTFLTYARDSLWRDPFSTVAITTGDRDAMSLLMGKRGKMYHYEECPLEAVITLLERPLGTIMISRLVNHPLHGWEQTARAFRFLLLEQIGKLSTGATSAPERDRISAPQDARVPEAKTKRN